MVTDGREPSYHRAERERFERLDQETPFANNVINHGFPYIVAPVHWLIGLIRKRFGGYRNG